MGIRSIHLLFVAAFAAAFLFSTTSAMIYHSENSLPMYFRDDDESECKKEIKKRCGDEIDDFKKELKDTSILGIVQSAASLAECLVSNIDHIIKKCLHFDVQPNEADIDYVFSIAVAENAVAKKSEPKCKDSVKKFCGDELDDLEDAINDFDSPKKMIKAAKEFIQCLIHHREDIKDDCDDDMKAITLAQSDDESKCHKAVYKKCGDDIHDLEDAVDEINVFDIIKYSFKTVACLTKNLSYIIENCKKGDVAQPSIGAATTASSGLRNFVGSDDDKGKCHNSLYELCGNEISALKKAIHNTSPNGIIGSSLQLSGCITSNFVKLAKACSPFDRNALSETSSEVDNIHFDFHDCVEMAKVQIKAETYGREGGYHYGHHSHGFMAAFIVFALLSAFFKGFLVGKGIDFCRKRFFPMRDAQIEPTNDVYSKMKDVSTTPLA